MGFIGYSEVKDGKRLYCLYDEEEKSDIENAHPAKFTVEDQFSKYRIEWKQKHGLLPGQKFAQKE